MTIDSGLISATEYATIVTECETHVLVSREQLEQEHRHLLARVQQLRRILGFPPLETGKDRRRQHA